MTICYLDGVCRQEHIERMRRRLDTIRLEGVLSPAAVEETVSGSRTTAFPLLQYTERTDKFCQGLLSGQIGLLVDGLPEGFLTPVSIGRLMQSPEDRAVDPVSATCVRALRYLALLASLLLPGWSLGSYISQDQLATLLGVDPTATSLQQVNDFQLDLKQLKTVQPANAKEGYLYLQLPNLTAGEDAPQLILGIEKQGLLKTLSPKVHILLDVPAHHIHAELTGTVTASQTVVTAPTSRMQDSDVESLVQLRKTIESIVQFVQTAAQSDDAAPAA